MSEEIIAMQKDLGLGHKGDIILTTQTRIDTNLEPIAKDVDIEYVELFTAAPKTKQDRDALLAACEDMKNLFKDLRDAADDRSDLTIWEAKLEAAIAQTKEK